MKKTLYIIIVSIATAFFFTGCKKETVDKPVQTLIPPNYLSVVQKYVRQHVPGNAYNSIDFSHYHLSKQRSKWYVRFPIKNKLWYNDFVLLQTDRLGNTSDAGIVHLEKTPPATDQISNEKAINHSPNFNGSIVISSLDKKTIIHSAITNGYIEAFHPNLSGRNTREESLPYSYEDLPEVIVVAYLPVVNEGSSFSFADYIMLQSMFGGGGYNDGGSGGGDVNTAVYSYAGGYGSLPASPNGGEVGQPTQYAMPADLPDIAIAPDNSWSHPQIDMNAWMKCFTDIPDAGAVCSVTLLGDLPVDTDPSIGLNIWSGNTGHCFLQLTKTNGAQSVTQIIGFTAENPGAAIMNTDAFVPGKTVGNAGHKYDCAITMNLSSYRFSTVIEKMKTLSSVMPYSVEHYDCLDYGLEVFNSVRPVNPLVIPKVYNPNDPFSNIATGPKLYVLLENMVASGSPEAGNIFIAGPMYAGVSHGACD